MKIRVFLYALLLVLISSPIIGVSQDNNLYVGYVGWSGSLKDKISIIDTTEGNFSVVGADQITLTTDVDGVIRGCYGLATNPETNVMYIIYQTEEGGRAARRLGTLNTSTGEISDIGIAGNVRDITFVENELYGTTGSNPDDYQLLSIDITTGTSTAAMVHESQQEGATLTYNYCSGKIIKLDDGPIMETIDPITLISDPSTYTGQPGDDFHASALLNVNQMLVVHRQDLYFFNIEEQDFEFISSFSSEPQAIAFGSHPEGVVSIPEVDQQEERFSAYPAITKDQVTIKSLKSNLSETYTLELIDMSGKTVELKTLNSDGENIFKLAHLNSGTYLIRIRGQQYEQTIRVIKE